MLDLSLFAVKDLQNIRGSFHHKKEKKNRNVLSGNQMAYI